MATNNISIPRVPTLIERAAKKLAVEGISRQYRWQLLRIIAGQCAKCGADKKEEGREQVQLCKRCSKRETVNRKIAAKRRRRRIAVEKRRRAIIAAGGVS